MQVFALRLAALDYDARVTQEIIDNPGRPLLLAPGPLLPPEAEAIR
jgi:hypothetical protein